MLKHIKKVLALSLVCGLVTSFVPVETVWAEQNTEVNEEMPDINEIESESEKEEQEVVWETQTFEQRLNYVYVESPYLEAPGTQNIVVSWGDGTEQITEMSIVLRKQDGTTEEWKSQRDLDNLHLFAKKFEEGSMADTYEVTDIRFLQEGIQQTYKLSEFNDVTANFGVNKEYEGYNQNASLSEEGVSEKDIEESVVVFDDNGNVESKNDITEALEEVTGGAEKLSKGRTSEVVVALDPGHDATHGGAQGNGLKEDVLTLKIATYAKEELEKYSGIKVYMTRSAACPYPGTTSGDCNKNRVKAAYEAGAKIYVSFHLNSTVGTTTTANGAEIIYPNSNWKPQVGADGKALAQLIKKELLKLGLADRGIYDKSAQDDKYPDGSLQDWFGVQRYCKEKNIPGIIIEHAFINNTNDANKFLKTEAGLKKLGVADATGIVNFLALNTGNQGWETDANGNQYYYEDGKKVFGGKKIGDYWYYFDTNTGIMYKGWRTNANGDTYYYDEQGHMIVRGNKIGDYWYYFNENNGIMHKGWRTNASGQTCYYNAEGRMLFKGQKIEGYWYYFNENNGVMHKGFRTNASGQTCYYNAEGRMLFKGQKIEGYWYYFNENNGVMHKGFRTNASGQTCYYNAEGRMLFKGQKIEGYWYYFNENNGIMHKGWRTNANGDTYYYDEQGHMKTAGQKINGYWYYFNENTGIMHKGFRTNAKGDTYYYDEQGHMKTGGQKIDGHWYYFNENNGIMYKGWRTNAKGDTYYYDVNGWLTFGWKIIDGMNCHFNENNGILLSKEPANTKALTKIEGASKITVQQMVDLYKKNSPIEFPAEIMAKGGAENLEKFASIYCEEAKKEGIKPEIAWVQSMIETGWLKFSGQVKIEQYNFAGLGAMDGGTQGADFSSYGKNAVRIGVRAQIQHLKAYASSTITESTLKEACVDPRFKYVNPKGCAQYVEYLGQQENPDHKGWATIEEYGYKIMALVEKM